MIEVALKAVSEQQDLLSIKCKNCNHTRVYSRSDLEPSGYNRCVLCNCLLPDIEALVYYTEHRITHHIRCSEHFMR